MPGRDSPTLANGFSSGVVPGSIVGAEEVVMAVGSRTRETWQKECERARSGEISAVQHLRCIHMLMQQS
jgi:hypothetical protein